MKEEFSRTKLLLGESSLNKLEQAKVIVFGCGGVGSYVVEGLARSNVGHIALVDNDTVSISNINRQLIATHSTVGKYKVDVEKERILDINPECEVKTFKTFVLKDNLDEFHLEDYDYIVDCIDTITAKISLILKANQLNIKIISSMGTGNKLDPTQFEVTDIYKTSVCPLAKVMRHELKKRGIKKLKVLYSKETALTPNEDIRSEDNPNKQIPGSVSFVPSVGGLIIASHVIKDLIKEETHE